MSGLLRYQVFLGYGFLFLAVWYAALSNQKDLESPNSLIVYAPVWAIILLAIYGIGSIAYGVAVFEDMPEAAAEMDKQIIEARQEMRKRGVIKE
jgi:dolichyl-phosphate mannosyltransferase polypeptide 3